MQQKKTIRLVALAILLQIVSPGATCHARAQSEEAPYPAMAPLDQYLMKDENSEIALARSAGYAETVRFHQRQRESVWL